MELRAIRALVEVVNERGFSKAAKKLHLTQSSVSKAVRQLEDELRLNLLDRLGHKSRLTEAGRVVYERGLSMLAQGESLRAELDDLRGLRSGTLRLGLPAMGSHNLFAHWFALFRQKYPGVNVQLVEQGGKHLEKLILAGELDLAATLLPIAKTFDWQEVRREPIDVLLPEHHPLAARRRIRLDQLAGETFILYAPWFALNEVILNACQANGFQPRIAAQSSQVDFVVELVAANLGIGFAPRMIAEEKAHPLVRRVPLQPPLFWHMALIWRRGAYQSQAARAWLALGKTARQE